MLVSVDDLFACGVGADAAGALLLAKGLLASPGAMIRRSKGALALNASVSVELVRDRVSAETGLAAIGAGFALQAAGYVLAASGVHGGRVGVFPGVGAALLAVGSAVATYLIWRVTAEARHRALLVELARHDGWQRHNRPGSHHLQMFGQAAGYHLSAAEMSSGVADLKAYAKRVFDVDVDDWDIKDALAR